MKKNQNGVSMVSLVITIIVIIILAAVAFSGSQETIARAGFSGFTTDIDSVETAFMTEGVTNLMGTETQKSNPVNEAQAINYLAKGATTTLVPEANKKAAWLTKAQAGAIQCTRIEKESAKEAIGIELPERTVNTFGSTGVEMSYFVTPEGIIFVWPPYERTDEDLFYINEDIAVSGDGVGLIRSANQELMYKDDFTFEVGGRMITVSTDLTEIATAVASDEDFTDVAGIYYKDEVDTPAPEGIESSHIFQNNGNAIAGVDKED